MKILDIIEYKPLSVPRDDIPKSVVDELRQKYRSQVKVELKDTKKGDLWQLTSQGWVGHIPLTPELAINLQPKVPVKNLFGMLEYAFDLNSFRFLDGKIDCQTLEEFYERLAAQLASRTLDRCRQGVYRAYLPKTGNLAYVRGRLDVRQAIQKPWTVQLKGHYDELTADIEDNQILAWTLYLIARTGICRKETVLSNIRQAYHALQGFVTLQPFKPEDCIGRKYNRLNQDYQPLHALCRFFLEHAGPSHDRGNNTMLPFLVNMDRLYELFVAEWLKAHLPAGFDIKAQERIHIDTGKTLHFNLDLVLYDRATGTARCVLDTKYKTTLVSDDVMQVVAYAVSKGSRQAILVCPAALNSPLNTSVGHVRVRSLTFSLDGNLEDAGEAFLRDLL